MKLLVDKIISKFRYAFSGLSYGLKKDRSIQIQYIISALVIGVCLFLPLESWMWCTIIFLCALVIVLEYLNSVIERLCDLYFSEYDERIKIIKDMAAAIVLVISICAAVIGIIIIGGVL